MVMSLFLDIPDIVNINESQMSAMIDILDVIIGSSLPYGISWLLVDHALILIWLVEESHWVLAIFNVMERNFCVCNTFRKNSVKSCAQECFVFFI